MENLKLPEISGISVLAVPFCPGLRELDVRPIGSSLMASLLVLVECPGIFLKFLST